jgi:ElaB/YqjD/DUF883 family membrane-anchored ribosome-binding protein
MDDRNDPEPSSPVHDPALHQRLARFRGQLEEIDARTRNLVRERPLAAVGTALVLGYAVARLLARR